jgi:hypothetical protein
MQAGHPAPTSPSHCSSIRFHIQVRLPHLLLGQDTLCTARETHFATRRQAQAREAFHSWTWHDGADFWVVAGRADRAGGECNPWRAPNRPTASGPLVAHCAQDCILTARMRCQVVELLAGSALMRPRQLWPSSPAGGGPSWPWPAAVHRGGRAPRSADSDRRGGAAYARGGCRAAAAAHPGGGGACARACCPQRGRRPLDGPQVGAVQVDRVPRRRLRPHCLHGAPPRRELPAAPGHRPRLHRAVRVLPHAPRGGLCPPAAPAGAGWLPCGGSAPLPLPQRQRDLQHHQASTQRLCWQAGGHGQAGTQQAHVQGHTVQHDGAGGVEGQACSAKGSSGEEGCVS